LRLSWHSDAACLDDLECCTSILARDAASMLPHIRYTSAALSLHTLYDRVSCFWGCCTTRCRALTYIFTKCWNSVRWVFSKFAAALFNKALAKGGGYYPAFPQQCRLPQAFSVHHLLAGFKHVIERTYTYTCTCRACWQGC
jgi:hypothetical protein